MDPGPQSTSQEPESHPTIRHDLYTAVLLPTGAIVGLIVTFALFTTDRLIIPGLVDNREGTSVMILGVRVGSTESVPGQLWGLGFLTLFGAIGSCLGYVLGKGLGRLTQWGT